MYVRLCSDILLCLFLFFLPYTQVIFEGVRGPGIEGDIAIDDVTLEEGECPDPPSNRMFSILYTSP